VFIERVKLCLFLLNALITEKSGRRPAAEDICQRLLLSKKNQILIPLSAKMKAPTAAATLEEGFRQLLWVRQRHRITSYSGSRRPGYKAPRAGIRYYP
jgi:uncharacterized SAM-dependent methyltransferase